MDQQNRKVADNQGGLALQFIKGYRQRTGQTGKIDMSRFRYSTDNVQQEKSKHVLLGRRDSELVILIIELIDYGVEVFHNEEEKFQRWLKKPNLSLEGNTPESLLDTITGINEVNYCLNRLEYGSLA